MKELIEHNLSNIVGKWKGPPLLIEAAKAALLSPAKRIRPLLVCQIGRALGSQDVSMAASAIELFHTASLIADDLPCMDNASQRRGRPALHHQYGEATAILVTYGMISAGYQALQLGAVHLSEGRLSLALEITSRTTGFQGAVTGQYWDLFAPTEPSVAHLEEVAALKTGSLFELAFSLGWLFGGGALVELPKVQLAGIHFGIAFQLADDLEDMQLDQPSQNQAIASGRRATKERIEHHISIYQKQLAEIDFPMKFLDSFLRSLPLA